MSCDGSGNCSRRTVKRKRRRAEREADEARLDEHERRFHEVAQRAVDELNATRPPGTSPLPARVLRPGKGATRAERAAWDAQVEEDGRRLSELVEQGWAELQAKKRAAGL
jgi:hypothetical protein